MSQNMVDLPVDPTPTATQGDMQTIDRLIGAMDANPAVTTTIGQELKIPTILTIAYVVLSLPLIDKILENFSFFENNKIVKWVVKILAFFIFSYIAIKWM